MTGTPTHHGTGFRASAARVHAPVRGLARRPAFQLLALMMGLICGAQDVTPQVAPSETQLKAAFLVNFPKYVEWTAETDAQTNAPLVVATLGETDLSGDLRKMVTGKTINGRIVLFKVLTENDRLADCHVLFIPEAARRVPALLEKLKGTGVLTVGESGDFLENGGVINLARRDRKVRLEVCLEAAWQAKLKISSKLLSVADVVKGK